MDYSKPVRQDVQKAHLDKLRAGAAWVIQQRLDWKPARLTVAVEYHIEKLRHVMYVRADSWVFTAALPDATVEDRDEALSIEYFAAKAAFHLNAMHLKQGPPSVAPAPKRTKDEGPYPPWT